MHITTKTNYKWGKPAKDAYEEGDKVKATFYVDLPVDDVIKKVGDFLIGHEFIFSEEESAYVVRCGNKKIEKSRNWTRFWSRKWLGKCSDHSIAKYPDHYSIVIQGVISQENEESVIELEILEYHASREHIYGGARAIHEYFDKFCKIFEK